MTHPVNYAKTQLARPKVAQPTTQSSNRPIGYFVHHQGRGHAERCAAVLRSLPPERSARVFCARPEILPELSANVTVQTIPSLFERQEPTAPALDAAETPATMHCVPLGWASVREAVATITAWVAEADPALFVVDVSAELCQLLRIASVPVVSVLQHGDRSDPGHCAAYESSVGILAPFAESLEQEDRPEKFRRKTRYFAGIGTPAPVDAAACDQKIARRRLGLSSNKRIALVIAGAGGVGTPTTPLTMAARAMPDTLFLMVGTTASEWHETDVPNLRALGWVDNIDTYLAAADVIIGSTGNTTVHQIAAVGRPWLAIPEWRYFDEQRCKALALARINGAAMRETWPASPGAWRQALSDAYACDLEVQKALVSPNAAADAAHWLDDMASALWSEADNVVRMAAI